MSKKVEKYKKIIIYKINLKLYYINTQIKNNRNGNIKWKK